MAFADRSGATVTVTVTVTSGALGTINSARWSRHPARVPTALAPQGTGTRTTSTGDMGLPQSKRVSGGRWLARLGDRDTPVAWAGPPVPCAGGGRGQQGPPQNVSQGATLMSQSQTSGCPHASPGIQPGDPSPSLGSRVNTETIRSPPSPSHSPWPAPSSQGGRDPGGGSVPTGDSHGWTEEVQPQRTHG